MIMGRPRGREFPVKTIVHNHHKESGLEPTIDSSVLKSSLRDSQGVRRFPQEFSNMAPKPKTPEDKAKLIAAMKQKVSAYLTDDYWTSDGYLYKWIEDKAYNVDKAEKALRKCLKWRLENDIDSILDEDFEDLHSNLVYFMDGRDKEGRVVVTLPCNLCNIRGAFDGGNKERLLRFFRQMIERSASLVRAACLENPGGPSTIVSIIDFEGVDMTKATPDVVGFCIGNATSMEDFYPGQSEMTFIINASKGVKNLYAFAKATLRKHTVERVKVFGTKRHKWEPAILAMVDADQLRPRFGGTMVDTTVHEIQDLSFNLKELKEMVKLKLNE